MFDNYGQGLLSTLPFLTGESVLRNNGQRFLTSYRIIPHLHLRPLQRERKKDSKEEAGYVKSHFKVQLYAEIFSKLIGRLISLSLCIRYKFLKLFQVIFSLELLPNEKCK